MFKQKVAMRRIRVPSPSGLAAGVVITLALLSAACNDSAPGILSPTRQLNASVQQMSASAQSSTGALNFTVLANAAVSCKDGSIAGNVGTFLATPSGAITQVDRK